MNLNNKYSPQIMQIMQIGADLSANICEISGKMINNCFDY